MARAKSVPPASTANIGFEAKLWLTADQLRNNMDGGVFNHVVLGPSPARATTSKPLPKTRPNTKPRASSWCPPMAVDPPFRSGLRELITVIVTIELTAASHGSEVEARVQKKTCPN